MFAAPMRFLRFQLAYIAVNALGKGRSIYSGTDKGGRFGELYLPRLGTVLGLAYLIALGAALRYLAGTGRTAAARGWKARRAAKNRQARRRCRQGREASPAHRGSGRDGASG
jgi:hypothetical protein